MNTMERDKLIDKHKPKYCPSCGKPIDDCVGIYARDREGLEENGGHDCWCEHCKWSGDILPDSLVDLPQPKAE